MGACCSCHKGIRFENNFFNEEEEEREPEIEDIVLRGDSGARIQLQGSSKYVSMFSKQGKKGHNQDAMTVWESFSGDKDMVFCSVFDGHGPSGHNVARYVRDFLPTRISKLYKQSSTDGRTGMLDVINEDDEDTDYRNPFLLSWKARFIKCFNEMDDQLQGDSSIESYCSGTTAVSVLKKGEHLIISNLGDSRAVLCTRGEHDEMVAEQLTVDLKPNLPSEAQRIRSRQGRVLAMEEEPNVYRIWMPDTDSPGLAMARAFGDFCLKDYGLISTPEVTYRKLTDKDEFVVLATDGIWDVLSNEEVVKIVSSSRKRSLAAKLLVEKAHRAWRYKYPLAKVDDCAAVCLFFKRQRAILTKSISEKSHLSLNYSELGANSHTRKVNTDDGLDTVLNLKIDESPDNGVSADDAVHMPRKRRPVRKFVEYREEY